MTRYSSLLKATSLATYYFGWQVQQKLSLLDSIPPGTKCNLLQVSCTNMKGYQPVCVFVLAGLQKHEIVGIRGLYFNKRNVTRKAESYTQLWQILILSKRQVINRERKYLQLARSCSLQQAVKMSRYGSLININPSGRNKMGDEAEQQSS